MFARLKSKIKSKNKVAKLSIITEDCVKRNLTTPESLKKLLQSKNNSEFDLSYSGSEISDVFEKEHDIFTIKLQSEKPFRSKNQPVMGSFTSEYKQTMLNMRKELQIGDNIAAESIEDIKQILIKKPTPSDIPESLQKRIEEILKDSEFLYSSSSDESDDDANKNNSKSIKKNTGKPFKIHRGLKTSADLELHPVNCDTQEEKQEKPTVSWHTLNLSRLKCEKWLNKQKFPKIK